MTSVNPWPIALVGYLRGGKVLFSQKALAQQTRGRKDCEIEIIIERKHATRSIAQNRMYWGFYVHLISEHTGDTPEEVHELLKVMFLPKKLAMPDENGEAQEFVIGGSTAKLNKIEFGEYLERIQIWAAKTLEVVVPDPPVVEDALDDRRGRQAVAP